MLNKIIAYLPEIWKAIIAGVGAFSAEYALAEQMGNVTVGVWIYLILSAAAIGAATYAKRNQPGAGTIMKRTIAIVAIMMVGLFGANAQASAAPDTHSIPAIYVCRYVNPLGHYLNAYLTQHYGPTGNLYRCEYRGVFSPSTICILVVEGDPNAYWYAPGPYDPTPCW